MKRVVALQMGFLNGRRVRPGTELDVPDDFKGSWVAPVDSPAAEAPKAAAKGKKTQPVALSEIAKEQPQGPTDLA